MLKVIGSNNTLPDKSSFTIESRNRMEVVGDNNIIKIGKNCDINNTIFFINGSNNIIEIGDNTKCYNSIVKVLGNKNTFKSGANVKLMFTSVYFTFDSVTNNSNIIIGDNTSSEGAFVVVSENASSITIGEDCMIAEKVEIYASDMHSVIDIDGNLLNYCTNVEIGNHVWLGRDARIGKRAKISDNSIVAWNSVVVSKFNEKNVIIAGNPAIIVKKDINWDRLSPELYKAKQS